MPYYHIYIHYKQKEKDKFDFPNDVNFSRNEAEEVVEKYENGDDFLLGGFTVHSDLSHVKKFEIWETSNKLAIPVDWNNMWQIARLVTREFTTAIPGTRNPVAKKEKTDICIDQKSRKWDLFICHASEDKEEIVRPLVEALVKAGFDVWYDECTLTLGDNLRRSIDKGLAQSRYGLAVLSPSFFSKEWPQTELDGLAARERDGRKVILPVWHKVDKEYVVKFSPTLADRLAVSTKRGIDKVVEEVLRAVKPARVPSKKQPSGKARVESVVGRLDHALNFLREGSRRSVTKIVKEMKFNKLQEMFMDTLDGVAFFGLSDSPANTPIFEFIEIAIIERNRQEGAELFQALLNWYFQTVTPNCKYSILEIFAHLTTLSHIKKVVSKTNRTSSFIAEFGTSDSYEIAGISAEIIQNIQSYLSITDCRKIVDFALSSDQILFSWRANRYLKKVLSSCEGKVDRAKMEELHNMLTEQMRGQSYT